MKYLFSIIILGVIIFNFSCLESNKQKTENKDGMASVQSEPAVSSQQTRKVIEHHLTAFGENNLTAIMADYADGAILATPDSTYRGLKQIGAFFEGVFPSFPSEKTVSEIDKLVIENELAYIVWHAKTPTVEVPLGTDTFIIEDGKIKLQTFTGVINPIK